MRTAASELAYRLARDAEAVCRHYLPNGRREGRYWLVGDVDNTPGRSLFVRLTGPESGKGAAGRWTDAATGEHGDLLDLIAANRRLDGLRDVLEEARSFLRLPRIEPLTREHRLSAPTSSPEAARRLWAISRPILGTVAEAYLRTRGITDLRNCANLRFHPRCWYRGDEDDPADRRRDAWPALIAAVRDGDGTLTASIAPGSRSTGRTRHRCRRRDAPWATCSDTASGSGSRTTCWRSARASKPCSRSSRPRRRYR